MMATAKKAKKSMEIEENDDGSFTTRSTMHHPDKEYPKNREETKESHGNVEELKEHVHKHFGGGKSEKKEEKKENGTNYKHNMLKKAAGKMKEKE